MFDHGRPARQQGLTLVEILVAILISLILIAGVIQIFVGTRQTYRFQDALARVQENGRFAAETISRDVRLAGFVGCTTLISVTPNPVPPLAVDYTRDTYIAAVPTGGAPATQAPGTDSLTLRMLEPATMRLNVDMLNPGDVVTVPANLQGVQVGDVVGVADCNNVDLFTVNAVAGAGPVTVTPNAPLRVAYVTGAELSRYREVTYFVAPGASGDLALWRRDDGVDTELVDGVEDLWVRYGEDLDNDGAPDAYVDAGAVIDWSRIRSVRIALLLVSNEDNVTGGPQPVDFRGAAVAPADGRYRQVLTTTIGLRNRLP
ncbi:PilW family protein [Thioalkalivibrio sp. XN8]|uniref:PilW family protein n=1 Tax=Thioalkalivibrio sp. XN8 TaxID=2712863 RepID=UPI0013EB3465|nr:PilW family protein [Thioalkalivibrio sp. XN8]NGP54796.1 prepilin-type N-terminal cleavage/methylation domain-containing protein [Thioalkalivibrio sp. XN8]